MTHSFRSSRTSTLMNEKQMNFSVRLFIYLFLKYPEWHQFLTLSKKCKFRWWCVFQITLGVSNGWSHHPLMSITIRPNAITTRFFLFFATTTYSHNLFSIILRLSLAHSLQLFGCRVVRMNFIQMWLATNGESEGTGGPTRFFFLSSIRLRACRKAEPHSCQSCPTFLIPGMEFRWSLAQVRPPNKHDIY